MTGRPERGVPPPAPEEVGVPGDGMAEGAPAAAGDVDAGAPTREPGPTDPGGTILTDVAALAAERDEYLTALQRLKADFDNYRKRVLRQQEEQTARAEGNLVGKLLPVLDNLDLAWAHLGGAGNGGDEETRALGQARAQILDVLGKEGLERVDSADVPFDPQVHDAVAHAAAPEAAGSPGAEGVTAGTASGPDSAGSTPAGAGGTAGTDAATQSAAEGSRPETATGDDGGTSGTESGSGFMVAEIMRAGYRWRGQVLRPAMVRVRG